MEIINLIFDFFTAPYKEASSIDIGLEVTAVLFGIISVVFAQKASVWVYPTGLVSTLIYVYVCLQYVLLGDMIINIYYSLVSLYGWYLWASATDQKPLPISFCSPKEWLQVGLIFGFTVLFIIGLYLYFDRFNQFTDYADTFTTGIFFAGMWLMANKKIENWIFWIVGNIISVPLYWVKGLGFSSVQFSVFLILAVYGYIAWKKSYFRTKTI